MCARNYLEAVVRATILAMCIVFSGVLGAQTITVTTLNDSGPGSLREAITQTNAVAGTGTINFGSGVTGTILLQSSLPQVTEHVTIIGPGRDLLTIRIDTGINERILESAVGIPMGLQRLTLSGGRARQGGGIFARGLLTINDVRIEDCRAVGADSVAGPGESAEGGAIFYQPVLFGMTLSNSLIINCHAIGGTGGGGDGGDANGGALYIANGGGIFASVTFENCTATGGSGTADGGNASGGAIHNVVYATFTDCVFENCAATGGDGDTGGEAWGGALRLLSAGKLTDCTIRGCEATGGDGTTIGGDAAGGALTSAGNPNTDNDLTRLLVVNCVAQAGAPGGVAQGGALYVTSEDTNLYESWIRDNSTIDSAAVATGAVVVFDVAAAYAIERTTFSGNADAGLAIVSGPSVALINNTFSGNDAGLTVANGTVTLSYNTVADNIGDGLAVSGGVVTAIGNIIAGNGGAGPDVNVTGGTVASGGANVIGIGDANNTFLHGLNGNVVGTAMTPVDPMLGSLQDYGGPTPTRSLNAGSPAIDIGSAGTAPSTDQRNAPRNVGAPDAGSFEFDATVPGGPKSGGEGDDRCSTTDAPGLPYIGLLAAAAVGLFALRRRKCRLCC